MQYNKAFSTPEKYDEAFPLFLSLTVAYVDIDNADFLGFPPRRQGRLKAAGLEELVICFLTCMFYQAPRPCATWWLDESFILSTSQELRVSVSDLDNSLIKLYLPAVSNVTWALPSFHVQTASPSIPVYYRVCN